MQTRGTMFTDHRDVEWLYEKHDYPNESRTEWAG